MGQDRRAAAELADCAAVVASQVHKTIRGREALIDKELSLSLKQLLACVFKKT